MYIPAKFKEHFVELLPQTLIEDMSHVLYFLLFKIMKSIHVYGCAVHVLFSFV